MSKGAAPPSEGTTGARPDRTLGRRQVLKAGAWSAPVLALAIAVPAEASSVTPVGEITLTSSCAAVSGRVTDHGFTVTNQSDQPATVLVSFTAQAWGITRLAARRNVATVTSSAIEATYPVSKSFGVLIGGNDTYQTIWEPTGGIDTQPDTSDLGYNAVRSGTASFFLPPGGFATLSQVNANVLGEPSVSAVVAQIDGQAVTDGAVAQFRFTWGGFCRAS